MPRLQRSYSVITKEALRLLSMQIKMARKERRMTEAELAERIGVARSTVQLIEKGAPTVAVGLVFEAARVVGVGLFVPEATSLTPLVERAQDRLTLLPKSIRRRKAVADNDF
ncbi:MAG: helix-turn-helix domain-containing protein [Gammaproteobacteria bacterium]|nr:helix-turn-helix domain-containing protein [Gammaproteobacteria bacterium]